MTSNQPLLSSNTQKNQTNQVNPNASSTVNSNNGGIMISMKAPRGNPATNASNEYVNEDVSFLSMTTLLTKKNFLQQAKRRPKSWLCKVLCPMLCFLILATLRTAVPVQNKKANYGIETTPCKHERCYYDWPEYIVNESLVAWRVIPWALCLGVADSDLEDFTPGYLGIAPDPRTLLASADSNDRVKGEAIQNVLDRINSTWQTFGNFTASEERECAEILGTCMCNASLLNFKEGELIRYFESSQDMDNYVKKNHYGVGYDGDYSVNSNRRPIGTGIAFDTTEMNLSISEITGEPYVKIWSYEIRQNATIVPNTQKENRVQTFTRELKDVWKASTQPYDDARFVHIQSMFTDAITEYIGVFGSGMDQSEVREYTTGITKGFHTFPAAKYDRDLYWVYLAGLFSFFMMISFIVPFNTISSALVEEKASKTKEGMKMMGMTNATYWMAWFFWLWLEYTLIIVGCIVIAALGDVFKYSDLGLIFVWLYLYGMSVLTFGVLVSTFFDNPKTASIMSTVILIATNIAGNYGAGVDRGSKTAICLMAPSCLTISTGTIEQYESGLIGVQWDNIGEVYNDFKFQTCLIMMGFDAILYLVLALYLDRVWPSQFGTRDPFYFLCLPSFWCPKKEDPSKGTESAANLRRRMSSIMGSEAYERLDEKMLSVSPAVRIRDLRKEFSDPFSSKVVKAVNGISLDMYIGEVFCLLGHNGAGKTTTIGMLTGLLEVTSGAAHILGYDVRSPEMRAIRKSMGVCPQHDVLWSRLTVKEHLMLFARLKGVPKEYLQSEAEKVIEDVGLSAQADEFPPNMSGGQKRKLSLGIALIGGSQIVFLDEPTSGMDPQSRRVTWDLIEKEKQNRLIILTTHFMDEADLLGDRIAIMSTGVVRCCGSPLFLKRLYGVGYTFTVSLKVGVKASQVSDSIDQIVLDVPGSSFLSVAGGEIAYRLSFDQTGAFPDMFESLDSASERLGINSYGISVTTLEEVFMKIEENFGDIDEETGTKSGAATMARRRSQEAMAIAFNEEKENENDDDDNRSERQALRVSATDKGTMEVSFNERPPQYGTQGQKVPARHASNVSADGLDLFKQPEFVYANNSTWTDELHVFITHLFAILYKRFYWSLRDFRALCYQILLPVCLSALGLGVQKIKIEYAMPRLEMDVNQYYKPSVTQIPFARFYNANFTENATESAIYGPANKFYIDPLFYDTYDHLDEGILVDFEAYFNESDYNATMLSWKKELLDRASDRKQVKYNGFYFSNQMWPNTTIDNDITIPDRAYDAYDYVSSVSIGVNASGFHALPTGYSLFNRWILKRYIDPSADIILYAHPLKVTSSQKAFNGALLGMFSALFLAIAFSFVPVGAVYNVVWEKSKMQRHQQLVSGVSIHSYWVGSYIADFLITIPTCLMVLAMVHAFDVDSFKGSAEGPFILTIFLFVLSVLPFTYLLSKFFTNPDKAVNTVASLYIFLGLILTIVSFILDEVNSETKQVNKILKYVWRTLPTFCMAQTLINIGLHPLAYASKSVWNYELYSIFFVAMAIESVIYFGVFLLSEWLSTFPEVLAKLGLTVDVPVDDHVDLDEDVAREQARIKQALLGDGNLDGSVDDTVVLAGLRKVYRGSSVLQSVWNKMRGIDDDPLASGHKVAVKDLFFGVPQGEVFGYLGVNGAGKTTTLKLLTGEIFPSRGGGFIHGNSIANQNVCRRFIGYCPQFDAIFHLLTAYEHLKFYGMIKGLRGEELEKQIEVLLNALSLQKYKNRRAGTYSGGNKRKLSAAIAMMGNPPVVFLDEPSTGMDPVSRRHMWEFISATMQGRCVILTTHSMEECEALCHRLGIMVAGQLQCLGTPQHLKSRFGKGYQLDILLDSEALRERGMDISSARGQVMTDLSRTFAHVKLIEANQSRMTLEISGDGKTKLTLASMFRTLEVKKESLPIVSYALNQTTLEQVFMKLAHAANATSEF